MVEELGEAGSRGTHDVVSLSVHGPVGVLDLLVPAGASSIDVASEYSRRADLPVIPLLYTPLGEPLLAASTLAESGLTSGSVVVAVPPDARVGTTSAPVRAAAEQPGSVGDRLTALACVVAVVAGVVAATCAVRLDGGDARRTVTVVVLALTALGCLVPLGPRSGRRRSCAPALAGAAALVLAWSPEPERLPTVLGVAALTAAVAAAVARALDSREDEGMRVTVAAGVLVFLVTAGGALVGVSSSVVWAVLLLLAMLAARFVPLLAVDVPDHYLLDLERLAVTAWSARERPTGRRGRIVVPRNAVAAVAASGQRMVGATSAAVAVVAVSAAALLLRDTHADVDLVGARVLVGAAGAALLLAARSHRHRAAQALLRVAGLGCEVALLVELSHHVGTPGRTALAAVAVAVGLLLVLVAVALGRGWRSAWWARQAEVAEGLCGSAAIGAAVVAVGLFRLLWK